MRTSSLLIAALTLSTAAACSEPVTSASPDTSAHYVDPLAVPAKPTLDPSHFNSANDCASCHPSHTREWRLSRHAFAMRDPVFRRLVALRNEAKAHTEDGFCTQCHTTIGTRGGDCVEGFTFDTLKPVTLEGVTCEGCHKSTEVVRTYNAGHKVDGKAALGATLPDPAANAFHESRTAPHLASADFCGSCHDVVETSGLPLERPHAEWRTSPARDKGQTCQDCHMPSRTGPAAVGGASRQLHSHLFVGVETQVGGGANLSAQDKAEVNGAIEKLLGSAADLSLSVSQSAATAQQLDVVLTVTNRIAGHNFPTGSTFLRQVWVALTVTDAAGETVYATGDLDANGDLRDHWSELDPYGDSDLISLSSRFVDAQGNRTLFTWEAVEHTSDAVEPLRDRTWTLFVPVPAKAVGPLKVQAKLRFRAYGPFLLRLLGLANLVSGFPIWDIDTADATVQLTP